MYSIVASRGRSSVDKRRFSVDKVCMNYEYACPMVAPPRGWQLNMNPLSLPPPMLNIPFYNFMQQKLPLKMTRSADAPLLAWIPEHQILLDEMMHLNGRRLEGVSYVEWVFFQHVTFKSLGVRVQLGHNPGEKCYNPVTSAGDNFVVIGIDRVHKIMLDFCGCASAQHFHLLSFKSKVSAYKFYHSLARCTDNNSGLLKIRCNIKQLGSAGRGHDPAGVDTTCEGELAVLCPACPQPGKNLPLDWEKELLFISLNVGWGYFVWDSMYKSYLVDHATEKQEQSTCVSHNAVNAADMKSSCGLAATGVGTINCARHDMKLPNGIGDLQKGEWYVLYINMDYVWHKKLWSQMETMPEWLHLPSESSLICFFVPKFHIQAHINKCHTNFSFNWSRYIGRTDGEAPKHGWANINRVASSTKEMEPGTCQDVLIVVIEHHVTEACLGSVLEVSWKFPILVFTAVYCCLPKLRLK
ncbi:hypothetical protein EDB19DRAFT_1833938 [Suillus lakei]|nr:hypothetical protein EDB19DRAFT_1833938 [Suillus lakei]